MTSINTDILGAINGVVGDYLVKTDNPLAISMDFFHHGKKLNGDISIAENDFNEWSDTLCLFLHGAADSEKRWLKDPITNYSLALYKRFKMLPLYLRYNSGLHISDNGKQFATLLESYLSNPKIKNVVVVSHSMGGLVFRSACYYANLSNFSWTKKIRDVFYLGSPHQGAPLEKFGAWTQSILEKIELPTTNAIKKLINIRSNGIKDLRHGYLIDEEWLKDQADSFPKNRKIPFPLSKNVNHYVVAATLQNNPDAIFSNWFGDAMVRKDSALGKSKEINHSLNYPKEHALIIGGTLHLKLTNNPAINTFIIEKLKTQFTA